MRNRSHLPDAPLADGYAAAAARRSLGDILANSRLRRRMLLLLLAWLCLSLARLLLSINAHAQY